MNSAQPLCPQPTAPEREKEKSVLLFGVVFASVDAAQDDRAEPGQSTAAMGLEQAWRNSARHHSRPPARGGS